MNQLAVAVAELPWTVLAVVLPLAGAAAVFVSRTGSAAIGLLSACGATVAAAGLAWRVQQTGPERHQIGGWRAPLGIELYADGLSACMMLLTAGVGLAVSVYALGYFSGGEDDADPGAGRADFWTLWLFLWAALNALFVSADVFNLYVTLELVTLASVGLVSVARTGAATSSALRYLIAALLGSLLYLLGVALLYATYGVLDIPSLGRLVTPGATTAAAVAAITAGLAVKAALFPLHVWLPPAHASAPAPVSAVLSGLVVTASFYLLLRLWFDAFATVGSGAAGTLLAVLGTGAIVWGSAQAILAPGLKALVAYSTVAQLGYLFLVFGLASPLERSSAWTGGVLFALSHGCAKASMFLAAGNVLRVGGHDRIAELGGISQRAPITFFTLALAGISLMGLPPGGTFVAKWMLLQAALERGQTALVIVIPVGGLLAAGYLFRILAQAFEPVGDAAGQPLPRTMELAALALAIISLFLGLLTAPLLTLLRIGAPLGGVAGTEVVP